MNFPIPKVDEQYENLRECNLFSTLDLVSGYLQVPLTEHAKEKTAFITSDKTGQLERMVFGLRNSPYVFSQLMNIVLEPIKGTTALWHLDDVLVGAKSWCEMM